MQRSERLAVAAVIILKLRAPLGNAGLKAGVRGWRVKCQLRGNFRAPRVDRRQFSAVAGAIDIIAQYPEPVRSYRSSADSVLHGSHGLLQFRSQRLQFSASNSA